jgi:GntR family transcriptional regulator/MocR family aminotransferase
MPIARRYALLEWARKHGAFILEDDYNGEFRHSGRSIEALAALTPGAGRVIYCGTLAKSLFPSLRLGYLALPKPLVAPAIATRWVQDRGCPTLMQLTVAELMATGEYDRHIRRMMRRYRARRAALIAALQARFGEEVEIAGSAAGLHLTVWLPRLTPQQVEELVATCRQRGVGVYSIADHAALPLRRGGLILGYGITDEDEIARGVKALAATYKEMTDEARPAPLRRRVAGQRPDRRSWTATRG